MAGVLLEDIQVGGKFRLDKNVTPRRTPRTRFWHTGPVDTPTQGLIGYNDMPNPGFDIVTQKFNSYHGKQRMCDIIEHSDQRRYFFIYRNRRRSSKHDRYIIDAFRGQIGFIIGYSSERLIKMTGDELRVILNKLESGELRLRGRKWRVKRKQNATPADNDYEFYKPKAGYDFPKLPIAYQNTHDFIYYPPI